MQDSLECYCRLGSGKLEPQAEMHTRSKGKVRIRATCDVELMGIVELGRVTIGGGQEACDAVASPKVMAGKFDTSRCPAGFGELDWRHMAEAFLYA
jgi:hypothetical protein